MANKNDFKPFAVDLNSQVMPQSQWDLETPRVMGHVTGLASQYLANKAERQGTLMAAAIGELITRAGMDAIDDGNVIQIADKVEAMIIFFARKMLFGVMKDTVVNGTPAMIGFDPTKNLPEGVFFAVDYDNPVAVTGLSLDKSSINIDVGSTSAIIASITPSDATNKTIIWESSNPSVASVNQSGVVTGITSGNATITAKTVDGSFQATCSVSVNPVYAIGIILNKDILNLDVAQSETLFATVFPSNTTNNGVTWSSNNYGIASVDSSGKVTGVTGGTATITAKTNDGTNLTATCTVTVATQTVSVTGIALDKLTMNLYVGETGWLTPIIYPSNATDQGLTWQGGSNPSVAYLTLDNPLVKTGTVHAVSAGTSIITVKTNDGGYQATCVVTVSVKPPTNVPVTGISIVDIQQNMSIEVGEQINNFHASVSPTNATNQNVKWEVSNPSVAKFINPLTGTYADELWQLGMDLLSLKAFAAGTCIITATAMDGSNVSGSVTINVTQSNTQATSISISGAASGSAAPYSQPFYYDDTHDFEVVFAPSGATDKYVDFKLQHMDGTPYMLGEGYELGRINDYTATVYLNPAFTNNELTVRLIFTARNGGLNNLVETVLLYFQH